MLHKSPLMMYLVALIAAVVWSTIQNLSFLPHVQDDPAAESHTINSDHDSFSPSPNEAIQRDSLIAPICFVTAEFAESIEEADRLPIPSHALHGETADGTRDDPIWDLSSNKNSTYRHFVFTNLPDYASVSLPNVNEYFETIVMTPDTTPVLSSFNRRITQSRWPKFLGWQHEKLQDCRVVFYGDAYVLNPINHTAWQFMARQILRSSRPQQGGHSVGVGLMQNRQMGANSKPVKGPVMELRRNARLGKVSWEGANATTDWLRHQPDYRPMGGTPVYKNALFGYDPKNPRFQRLALDFWQEYSKETGSWRDQPYWAYFLSKHGMTPLPFPFHPPMGPSGTRGHNGHIYVTP